MLASERGVRAGLLAATGAVVCTVFWAWLQEVPLGVIGYGARAGTFVGIGVLVGLQSQKRLRLEGVRMELIAELRATAMRDQLTGLPNRRAWHDRLEQELAAASRSRRPLSVAVVDLDGLKQVNDTHGHEQGDQLIRRSAHAWAAAVRRSDFLARLGGDEFVVLLARLHAGRRGGNRSADARRRAVRPDLLGRHRCLGSRRARLRASPSRRPSDVRGEGGGRRGYRCDS